MQIPRQAPERTGQWDLYSGRFTKKISKKGRKPLQRQTMQLKE